MHVAEWDELVVDVRSQGHSQTTQMNQEATEYPGLDLSLDPPYGFKDQHETTNHNKKINRKSNSSTEYAIAVWQ